MIVPARLLLLAALLASASWADPPATNPTQAPPPGPMPAPPGSPQPGPPATAQPAPPPPRQAPYWISRWFNPATAPFIPVPEIGVDPNSGTTLGLIPTWVHSDENHEINRIIAPDILYNPYFGFGVHGRVYGYTSEDEQWSVVTGIKERVEREFDAEYQKGRLRKDRWSFNTSVIYDRSGTPRFYGIGNESPAINETNYTNQQELLQVQAGLNLTHEWQLLYTARFQDVDVLPGTLANIASIQTRFGRALGIGTNKQVLNRLSLVYDTRDDLTVPTRGMQLIAYGGLASRNGLVDDSMYSEVGETGARSGPLRRTPSWSDIWRYAICRLRTRYRSGRSAASAGVKAWWAANSRCEASARDASTIAIRSPAAWSTGARCSPSMPLRPPSMWS